MHGENFKLLPIDPKQKFGPFELKRVEQVPPRKEKGGVRDGRRVVLTVFELGEHAIPPFPVPFVNEQGKQGQFMTEEVKVRVKSVGRTEADRDDIRPIKAPLKLPFGAAAKRVLLWGLSALAAALIAAAAFFFLRRKKKEDPESLLPPHERALLRLARLEKKNYLETQQAKLYFTELTEILQRYLIEQLRVGSEEFTTTETLDAMRQSELPLDAQGAVRDVLEIADLAKFAKWVPPIEESRGALRKARQVVEATRPRPEETTPDTGHRTPVTVQKS